MTVSVPLIARCTPPVIGASSVAMPWVHSAAAAPRRRRLRCSRLNVGFHPAAADDAARTEHRLAIRFSPSSGKQRRSRRLIGHVGGRSGDVRGLEARGFGDGAIVDDDIVAALDQAFGYRVADGAQPEKSNGGGPFAMGLEPPTASARLVQIAPVFCRCPVSYSCLFASRRGSDRPGKFRERVARPD